MTPNVHNARIPEERSKGPRRILRRHVRGETTPIPSSFKDSIEVPADDGGGTRVDVIRNELEEVASSGVPVGGVETDNRQRNIIIRQSQVNETTPRLQKKATKSVARTLEYQATGVGVTRRGQGKKAKGGKQ